MNNTKYYSLFVILLLTLCGGASAASSLGPAIDKAGSQRMLTQRMVKAYALLGMDLNPGARGELNAALTRFDKQLKDLSKVAETGEENEQIDKTRLLWSELRTELLNAPDASRIGQVNDLAELLLQESHQFVLLLEKRAGTQAGGMVNLAGRQRMLSQRIAKLYLLETWGMDAALVQQQYQGAVDEFSTALIQLHGAKINTAEITDALSQVDKNWKIFNISNYSKKYNTRVPSLVVRSMDKIMAQMNDVTAMYANLH